ncbi:MAG: phage tail family protein [Niameybacter sp.]
MLESVDWGVVESAHQSYKYIDQIGVYVTGTTLETRSITIVGWVAGEKYSEVQEKKKTLNVMINPKQPIDAIVDNYKIIFYPDSSVRYSVAYNENNEVVCKFMISGLCADPLFTSIAEHRVVGASTLPKFKFPLIIPKTKGIIMGLRQPSLIISMENSGAVPTGMRIEFQANGTVVNPKLIDANTQEFFAVNKTMVAGERIIINTNDGSKKISGELNNQVSNYYQYRDLDSTWLKLELGTNLFRYDADTNLDALEVYVYYSNKYLEVQ